MRSRAALALVAAGLLLGLPAAAQAGDELRFFSNAGKTVICRYSSFSGFQQLKCTDTRVLGEDGAPLTVQLKSKGRTEQLIFDSRPIEKTGKPTAKFSRGAFRCTLTASSVRCSNKARHGFVLKLPAPSFF